jgi:transcriptional regulator NrdR family protein
LSLYVVKEVKRFEPFLNRKETKELVSQLLGGVNNERLEDVTKMLHLNANVVYRRANDSPEFRAAVKERQAKRKTLQLVK